MALYKGKKALYEAIITKKNEPAPSSVSKMPERPAARPKGVAGSSLFHWPKKPKLVQHSGGRIEMSLTVPIVVTIGFGILVVLLVAYQIGKSTSKEQPIVTSAVATVPAARAAEVVKPARAEVEVAAAAPVSQTKAEQAKQEQPKPAVAVVASNKTNWIVIQQYQVSRDLEPVKEYFAKNGIDTKIVSRTSRGKQMFFLVSAEKFENTVKPGSEGYQMVQKIRKVGAGYKAPQNYESFAPHLFGDAYGEKVSQ
jgi:hypothetical protein